jgi:N6-adenosine-specific RNA methylase IME4
MALEEIRANDPLVARADLFSRVSRPEWDAWGHEAGKFEASVA